MAAGSEARAGRVAPDVRAAPGHDESDGFTGGALADALRRAGLDKGLDKG